MNRLFQRGTSCAVALLLLSGCASTDGSQLASGPGTPVATTPPLAIPPVLRQPEVAGAAVATTEPVAQPRTTVSTPPAATPTSLPVTTATPVGEAESSVATAVPATAVPATAVPATAVPATAAPATAVPEVSPTSASVAAATPTTAAAPNAASSSGPTIALGDFEVVNLVTGANQNIAELSPSGATMLWFWAPH